MIDSHIATFNPAELLEFLSKGGKPGVCFRIALGMGPKHADPPHPFAVLRPRHERPRRYAAKARNEIAPPHLQSSRSELALWGSRILARPSDLVCDRVDEWGPPEQAAGASHGAATGLAADGV